MLYDKNKLLIIRSNISNNYKGSECIIINNIISQNNQQISNDSIKIPYEIESVIQVGEFIFGRIPLYNNDNSKKRYYNILNIDNNGNYSNVNIQSNIIIVMNNIYYLMQRESNINIFKNISSTKFTNKTKNSLIALYNVASNETN
jgi:hypothetical protein